jgi:NADH-quinone oxidoreductase subunit C
MALTNEVVLTELQARFEEAILEVDNPYNLLTVVVQPEKAKEILAYLKGHRNWQFVFLTDLTGVHFPELTGHELAVVYHLHSLVHNFRIRFKAFIPIIHPVIATVSDLWSAADWMERETYDFFGILFEGHPNLKKILNIEEQDYFPMRKEYPLEDQTRQDKDDAMFGRDRNDPVVAQLRQQQNG